ncbi:MAG: protein SCO1/2 [Lentimonas sp.]|jgi:protein SCO1/2
MQNNILLSVIFLFGILALSSCDAQPKRALPYIGNFDLEYSTVDGEEIVDTIYPKMTEFSYLNEDSVMISSEDMKGKIWVSDFFFTTCPTICPTMTSQMKRLNKKTEDLASQIQFMSFSINPTRDTPRKLKEYKKRHGISVSNWHFFTGDEKKTHKLGIEHFQIFAGQDDLSAGGYAHSPAFTLVDKEGFIRGVYIGTDTKDVDRMADDIRKLLKIEYGYTGSK